MSQQVREGADAEEKFVEEMNRNKGDPRWKTLGFDDASSYYVVRVSTKKDSKIHDEKVACKSDAFVAKSEKAVEKFDLDEGDLEEYGLESVEGTGISIKKEVLKAKQWQKLAIDPFTKLFVNAELGAGISLYERKGANHDNIRESLECNRTIVEKWCGSVKAFEEFYCSMPGITKLDIAKLLDGKENDQTRAEIAIKIGGVADAKMKYMIDSDDVLAKKIFWGVGVFDEPFCASWVFEDGELKKTEGYIPTYYITTGNSRMKNWRIQIKSLKNSK